MKKTIKTILSLILGTTLITSCSSVGNLSGSMLDEVSEGSGEYDWKKYDVNIPFGTETETYYYSNCDGDYIYNLSFKHIVQQNQGSYRIMYSQYFNIADDLEAFFVLSNGYVTEVACSHVPFGAETIKFSYEQGNAINIKESSIVQIWLRTVD